MALCTGKCDIDLDETGMKSIIFLCNFAYLLYLTISEYDSVHRHVDWDVHGFTNLVVPSRESHHCVFGFSQYAKAKRHRLLQAPSSIDSEHVSARLDFSPLPIDHSKTAGF